MKLLVGWVLASSIVLAALIGSAYKYMPTGTNSAKFVATSSEINLIDNLLEKESVTRDYLTALLQQKQDHFKSDVIGHQVEVIPVVFVYLSVLIVSSLNIIFTLVGGWTLIRQGKYSKET